MANELKWRRIAAILCLALMALASSAAAMERDLVDLIDGTGARPAHWLGRTPIHRAGVGIRLSVHYAPVDTIIVNVECPESGPRALSLSRIRYKNRVIVTNAPDGVPHDHHRRAAREGSSRPLRRAAILWAVLSRMTRLVIAILGVAFF